MCFSVSDTGNSEDGQLASSTDTPKIESLLAGTREKNSGTPNCSLTYDLLVTLSDRFCREG